jgi:transglutaminase-like putative cysteine protease
MDIYLRPTSTIDCDNKLIKEKAQELVREQQEVPSKAKYLFYFVRDEIAYNLYVPSDKPEYYRASRILQENKGFCIQKAALLTALSRAVGIPARLHLAAIRNHLVPDELKQLMRGNLFPTHGYTEIYVEERWIKVAPTFDLRMCDKNRLITVEFDGVHNALLPAYNQDGELHIEYVQDRGHYDDLPFDKIIAWRLEALGADFPERMKQVIESRKRQA